MLNKSVNYYATEGEKKELLEMREALTQKQAHVQAMQMLNIADKTQEEMLALEIASAKASQEFDRLQAEYSRKIHAIAARAIDVESQPSDEGNTVLNEDEA